MKEQNKHREIFTISLSALGLLAIAFNAFSKKTRKEIGKRDHWTCQSCGKKFSDGFMVHAAHNSNEHQKSNPLYDDPSSGKILCVDCHQKQHEEGTALGYYGDLAAVRLLKVTDRRTRWWKNK